MDQLQKLKLEEVKVGGTAEDELWQDEGAVVPCGDEEGNDEALTWPRVERNILLMW